MRLFSEPDIMNHVC